MSMDREAGSIVFLSHNSSDKPAVEAIMRRLEAYTPPIHCWLDKDDLRAQGTWMQQIERVIETCEAAALFYSPHGFGRVHEGERQLLLDRAMRNSETFRLIPILLPGAKQADVAGFAKLHNWVDFSAALDSPAAMERLVALIRGEAPRDTLPDDELPDNLEPYRGLERFDSQHSDFFFGRDREICELCERIKTWPFVAVIGGSGSGKSSLVRAGLRTDLALRQLPSLRDVIEITVLPGSNPMRTLAEQLAAAGQREAAEARQPPEAEADAHEHRFRERPDGLLTLLTSRFPRDDQLILLHVDQFEELFTHGLNAREAPGHGHDQARQFVALLDAVARSRQERLRIIITLRADFFDRCLEVPALVPLVQNHQLLLGQLSREALQDVIVRPAQQAGAFFEKGLVARIQADVQNDHGSLPLLQHALKELWARRLGRWLINEAYDETGGVAGALRKRADETLRSFTPSQREIAKSLFLRLTTLGEGVSDTRRRVKLVEMYPADSAVRADVERVIDKLSGKAARLIVTNDDGTAEVTHESLIQQWDELRKWLDANRDQKRLQDRLRDAAHEWWETCHDDPQRRDSGYLWEGGRLEDAEAYERDQAGALNELEQAFLQASIRKRADESRLRTRRSRMTKTVAVLVAVLAVALTLAAYVANQQVTIASVNAAEAMRQKDLAILGGYNSEITIVDSIWRSDRRAAKRALTNDALFPTDLREFSWHYLNRLANHSPLESGPRPRPENLDLIAAAPTTDVRLAWIERDGQLWLWLPEEDGDPQRLLDAGEAKFLAFSSDGQRLLWSRGDGQVEFFDTQIQQAGRIATNASLNSAVAFSVSANGEQLLFAVGATVQQMDLRDGSAKEVVQLDTGGADVTRLAQSDDGKVVVATHGDRFSVIRVASPIESQTFDGVCHSLSPAGNFILVTWARASRAPIFFEVHGFELLPVAVLRVEDLGGLRVAAFSPDGNTLAVASNHLDLPGEISLYESKTGTLLSRSIGELYDKEKEEVKVNGKEDFEAIRFAGRGRVLFSWGGIATYDDFDGGFLKLRDAVTGGQRISELPSWAVSSQVRQSHSTYPQPKNVSFTAERIEIHSNNRGPQLKSISVMPGTTPTAVAISSDNAWVAYIGLRDGKHFAAMRRTIESEAWKVLSGEGKVSQGNALAFSPKNRWLAVAGAAESKAGQRAVPGAIDVWKCSDADATELNVAILAEPGPVNAVCFTEDERTLATGSDGPGYGESGLYNGMVRLWDPVTGQQRIALAGHQRHVDDVSFSPDGLQLVSSSGGSGDEPEVFLWDAREWKLRQDKTP